MQFEFVMAHPTTKTQYKIKYNDESDQSLKFRILTVDDADVTSKFALEDFRFMRRIQDQAEAIRGMIK